MTQAYRTRTIEVYQEKLEALDKLRGTGYWDFHYECLWHAFYKRLQELKQEVKN